MRVWQNFLINMIAPMPIWNIPIRNRIMKLGGIDVHHAAIFPHVRIYGDASKVKIHEGAGINSQTVLDAHADITLHSGAGISYNCVLVTAQHAMGDLDEDGRRWGALTAAPIVVGPGVWIGANVVILPGVTIGEGAVIGAGAVVTSDCEPNTLYVGTPAKPLKTVTPSDRAAAQVNAPRRLA